jgi:hypothetical protein
MLRYVAAVPKEAPNMTTHLKANGRLLLRATVAALTLLLPAHSAFAEPPEIVSADINTAAQTVTTSGHGFGVAIGRVALVGSRGSVEMELAVASWTDEQVVAFLPLGLAAGTYRLGIVTKGNGRNPGGSDIIDLTIADAAVTGPAGPAGPQGIAGPAGPAGPTGAAGPAGPTGAAGPVGPTGAVGPAGPAGASGPTGPTGVQGPVGAAGPGFQWKGSWDPQFQYASGDVVDHNGSSYVTMEPVPGDEPPGTAWHLMAAAGRDGAAGATGPTGPQGADGLPGATGAVGPIGPAGPQGPVGPASTVGASAISLPSVVGLNGVYQVVSTPMTMTVPAGVTASALVNAEGDIALAATPPNQATVEVHLVIDGVVARSLRTSVTNYSNSPMPGGWHLGTIQTLGPGPHEFHLEARTTFLNGGTVTMNSQSGNLSVALLRQ